MFTKEEVEFYKLKEPRIDWLEDEENAKKSPIHRKMIRLAEVPQEYTAWDLYRSRAEIEKDLNGLKTDLEPKNWKAKMAMWKEAMENKVKNLEKEYGLLDNEIKQLERDFDIEKIESEYQLALHEELKEKEAKLNLGAEQKEA